MVSQPLNLLLKNLEGHIHTHDTNHMTPAPVCVYKVTTTFLIHYSIGSRLFSACNFLSEQESIFTLLHKCLDI